LILEAKFISIRLLGSLLLPISFQNLLAGCVDKELENERGHHRHGEFVPESSIGEIRRAKVSETAPGGSWWSNHSKALAIAKQLGRDLSALKGNDVNLAAQLNV